MYGGIVLWHLVRSHRSLPKKNEPSARYRAKRGLVPARNFPGWPTSRNREHTPPSMQEAATLDGHLQPAVCPRPRLVLHGTVRGNGTDADGAFVIGGGVFDLCVAWGERPYSSNTKSWPRSLYSGVELESERMARMRGSYNSSQGSTTAAGHLSLRRS